MKIGILTFHYSNHNFGAVLQAYSLYKSIESLGHQAYIINFEPEADTIKDRLIAYLIKILGYQFEKFRKEHFPNMLMKTITEEELKGLNNVLDAFVVGSDQVWRYKGNKKLLCTYFFDFVDDEKRKISYAASFGIDKWEANEEISTEISRLIKRFQAVSVREESGVTICRENFGVNAVKVLDPTLLVDRSCFDELIKNTAQNESRNYLAYMLLDETKQNETYFRKFALEKKLKFISIKGKRISRSKNLFYYNHISKWLYYLKHANLVVTDSFHCVVFSIIFRKRFICLANNKRGTTRLLNLLKILNLEKYYFLGLKDFEENYEDEPIDYDSVASILESEKRKSIEFLKTNLT
ncbi:polysaccharide pyruvyl transferase family protein [Gaoshiqia sediminis]|uniref:Polysaccharide pyruvyl transferase family protein n=1 Tax=Gaoshiqia sediminis TaxID=2986998 RepID=A0AA41YAU5_9BACT|nr:polysaccharide pyruvyl transferase family protein [Gaoshiqia sediminis]MCW0482693.1 polysaccharide pyruvyl transferase family protein [Gaoshiqia sediminis]